VFVDGKKGGDTCAVRPLACPTFKKMVIDYIEQRYGHGGAGQTGGRIALQNSAQPPIVHRERQDRPR